MSDELNLLPEIGDAERVGFTVSSTANPPSQAQSALGSHILLRRLGRRWGRVIAARSPELHRAAL